MREDTTSLEAVEETPSLTVALRALATHLHPSLPSVVEQDRLDRWLIVREETGPGRPVTGAEPWGAARAADAGAGLCDGLEALERLTQGSLPVALAPEDLWITKAGILRLRKLGLPRWGDEPDLAGVMQGVVQAVLLLARPEEHAQLAWVAARCSQGDPARCYGGLRELGEALRRIAGESRVEGLRPPAPVTRLIRPKVRGPRLWPRALGAVLLLLLVLAGFAFPSRQPPRPQDGLVVAHGQRVSLLSPVTGRSLWDWDLPEPAFELAATPDGRWIFAGQHGTGGVLVLQPFTDREPWFLKVGPRPRDLVLDEAGERLFVTHPEHGLVSLVALGPRGPRSVGVLAVPAGPLEIATRNGLLYCSAGGAVSTFGLQPLQRLRTRRVPGAGPLVASLAGRFLYVADRARPRVRVLDASSLEQVDVVPLARTAERLVRFGGEVWALEPGLFQPVSSLAPWLPLPEGISDLATGRSLVWFLGGAALGAAPEQGQCVAWLQLPAGTARLAWVPAPRPRR